MQLLRLCYLDRSYSLTRDFTRNAYVVIIGCINDALKGIGIEMSCEAIMNKINNGEIILETILLTDEATLYIHGEAYSPNYAAEKRYIFTLPTEHKYLTK